MAQKSRLYTIWKNMKARCSNNASQNSYYGARGITVCEEWRNSYQAFYNWAMANGYTDELTIDRIDVNGNYEPSNCRWATLKEQANNKRNNRLLTYNGKSLTVSQWTKELGFNQGLISRRINYLGWDIERALTEPPYIGKNQTHKAVIK